MNKLQKQKLINQQGLSLVETITAIAVFIIAITVALGLATYAFSAATKTKSQIVALNLAREGIEVVRMMRDSNWLGAGTNGALDLSNCTYNYTTGQPSKNALCFPSAFNGPYADLNTQALSYRAVFKPSVNAWALETANAGSNHSLLCANPNGDGTYISYQAAEGLMCDNTFASYSRRIQITDGNTAYPFTANDNSPTASIGHSPEKVVRSAVVWKGKNCTDFNETIDPFTLTTQCKIIIEERLTNWKDFK